MKSQLAALSLVLLPIVAAPAVAAPTPSASRSVAPRKISLTFKVPSRGAPPTTAGGATRGTCVRGAKRLTPLVPPGSISLTVSERPSFFVYVPRSSAKTANLLLLSGDDRDVVYEATLKLPATAGVMRIDLPNTAPALETGKRYHWFLTLTCNASLDASGDPFVEGWVERTAPTRSLVKSVETMPLSDRPALYAESGIWHETLSSLSDLRRQAPLDTKLRSDWIELLNSVGLGTLANEPFAN
ncbi:DUF928 domain-containing protein [Leptolyngbya sp. FACHB-36]|uniref:DUF928 domain-containing protein n=1 Tax=Leptolyngbya sp. FACHB-36 TaxID=2692808 RepID=UPI001680ABA4|nr:DUF928 domain-containing protein [Leptolyngbya sp. FACHB-36]MBD2021824.1 DUF928 domain-containing protein [Leptolyngbya sp. FACHB-36]